MQSAASLPLDRPRVLVVDDEASIRRALVTSLTAEGYQVDAAGDLRSAASIFDSYPPDVVLLDIRLPNGREGFELGRAFRGASEVPIIFLTAVEGVEERLAAFGLGADDCLEKPFSMPELLARTRAVLRRSRRLVPGRLAVRDVVVDFDSCVASRSGKDLSLTDTEFRLLTTLARTPGQIFSKVQLLSEVRQFDAYAVNLVVVHMSALRRKLEAMGPGLIFTQRSRGYVLRP